MPVPKKRLGHSAQGHRRANWKAFLPTLTVCPNCHSPKHAHTLCGICGFYKDRVVSNQYEAVVKAPSGPDHDHDHGHDHGNHDHSH